MIEEKFDAIVVGAGMAGNAAALTLAQRGLKVLQLERGEYSGSKNVQGAILYADMLEEADPDFREDAPLERHLVEQRFWMMDDRSHTGLHYRSDDFNEEKPNRYTHHPCPVRQMVLLEGPRSRRATVVVRDHSDRACAGRLWQGHRRPHRSRRRRDPCRRGRAGGGRQRPARNARGLRDRPKPDKVALAVKEMHFLPRETIEARFNLRGDEGVVIEAAGTISRGMTGMGFIYANQECISLGIGCLVADFQRTGETPYGLLDRFKRHPRWRR